MKNEKSSIKKTTSQQRTSEKKVLSYKVLETTNMILNNAIEGQAQTIGELTKEIADVYVTLDEQMTEKKAYKRIALILTIISIILIVVVSIS